MSVAGPGLRPGAPVDELRPPQAELEAGVADGFTICFVGDCVISRPISALAGRDPGFRAVLEILRAADVVCGNLETALLDVRRFRGHPRSWEGDWPLVAVPAVAADLAAMNVRLVGRANNHALDWGVAGMRTTADALDDAGVVHAGAGEHGAAARAARHLETDGGRVALASFATTFAPFSDALDPHGEAPGRPGVSGLTLGRSVVLPPELADGLRAAAGALGGDGVRELFGFDVEAGPEDRAHQRYAPQPEQLRAILGSVRLAKQHADFLAVALHAHEAEDASPLGRAAAVVGELGRAAIV